MYLIKTIVLGNSRQHSVMQSALPLQKIEGDWKNCQYFEEISADFGNFCRFNVRKGRKGIEIFYVSEVFKEKETIRLKINKIDKENFKGFLCFVDGSKEKIITTGEFIQLSYPSHAILLLKEGELLQIDNYLFEVRNKELLEIEDGVRKKRLGLKNLIISGMKKVSA